MEIFYMIGKIKTMYSDILKLTKVCLMIMAKATGSRVFAYIYIQVDNNFVIYSITTIPNYEANFK